MDQNTRKRYGMITGAVGILLNIMLFIGKFIAGMMTGAISITADAFNNLSDAGSSVVTMLGFRLAEKKPDSDHPYGHGRMEYIAGLIVSILILLMGFELARTSIGKIVTPEEPLAGGFVTTLVILGISIVVKLIMFGYNHFYGKKIQSAVMRATAIDSLSDAVATFVVLVSYLVEHFTGYYIDGYAGVLVSGFILYSGIRAIKETSDPLLGKAPATELVEKIYALVKSHPEIVGIHDLIVHDYGPGRMMITLHVEVPEDGNMVELHEVIDRCERQLHQELGCYATIHMDPIAIHDETVLAMKNTLRQKIHAYHPGITIHDFHVVRNQNETSIVFDAVLPMEEKDSAAEVKRKLEEIVASMPGNCHGIIDIDLQYAGWQKNEAD